METLKFKCFRSLIDLSYISFVSKLLSNGVDTSFTASSKGGNKSLIITHDLRYIMDCFLLIYCDLKISKPYSTFVRTIDGKNSLLLEASKKGYYEMVTLLLDNGVNVNLDNGAPLRAAAEHGHFEIINLLINNGANVIPEMCIVLAAKNGHLEVVILLIKHGAVVNTDVMDNASMKGHLEVVKYLHSIGAKCTAYAMDWASENDHLEVVKYLHSIGVECTNCAMNWASEVGHLEVVKYLHSIGKKCTIDAMFWANWDGRLDVVKYLHSIGAISGPYLLYGYSLSILLSFLDITETGLYNLKVFTAQCKWVFLLRSKYSNSFTFILFLIFSHALSSLVKNLI